jgi:hypothetical protein
MALVTAGEAPETGGAQEPRFVAEVEQTRRQLAMAERPFTVAVRFRTKANGTLVANAKPKGKWSTDGKSLFINGGGRLTYDIGWVGAISTKQRVNDGKWHAALLTMDDGKARLFLDGEQAAERKNFARPHAKGTAFKIGSTAANFGGDFKGDIEWVRFFNRRSTTTHAASSAGATSPAAPSPYSGGPSKMADRGTTRETGRAVRVPRRRRSGRRHRRRDVANR